MTQKVYLLACRLRLLALLQPYRMNPESWWKKIARLARPNGLP